LPHVCGSEEAGAIRPRHRKLRASVQRWAQAMSDRPDRVGGRHPLFEKLDLRLPRRKSGMRESRRDARAAQNPEHAAESRLT
jgi:hypothetical protein